MNGPFTSHIRKSLARHFIQLFIESNPTFATKLKRFNIYFCIYVQSSSRTPHATHHIKQPSKAPNCIQIPPSRSATTTLSSLDYKPKQQQAQTRLIDKLIKASDHHHRAFHYQPRMSSLLSFGG